MRFCRPTGAAPRPRPRINESLDLDTVLQEVLDSARSLSDARYGVMALLDGSGGIKDFLGAGLSPDEARRLWELPEGSEFIEYLGAIPGPLRSRRPCRPHEVHGPARLPPALSGGLLPGHSHPPRGRGRGQHLPGQERPGPGVQPGG